MLAFTSFSRRRSSSSSTSSSLSLSPTGWNPSRPTISPPSISNLNPSSSPSDSDSEFLPRPNTSCTTCAPGSSLSTKRRAPRSLSPPPSSFTTTSALATHQACAFPSWPTRDSLTPPASTPSPTSSYFHLNSLPSSRISDADLEDLDFSTPNTSSGEEEVTACISWSNVGTGAVAPLQQPVVEQRRRRLPPPPAQYRRRSSSRVPGAKKGGKKALCAISE